MKYKCLVFDHDDTVVNSTATIHHPCFQEFLDIYSPGRKCTLEEYFIQNFDPGVIPMFRDIYGLSDEMMKVETDFWAEYVRHHVPSAYAGIREIMQRHKAGGGLICVVSYSFEEYIYRDYAENGLPEPDEVFGWTRPVEQRKPYPYPLEEIMRRFSLGPEELLVIDDLKPGADMAAACGVECACAGWSNDIPSIEEYNRANFSYYFKTVSELDAFLNWEGK